MDLKTGITVNAAVHLRQVQTAQPHPSAVKTFGSS